MDNNRKVVELPLDDVLPNRFQPRIKFNEDSINELSESIKEHGVIQPIVVRPVGDRYEIIAGERRYKATTMAGLSTIPAIITDLNDKDSAEVALIENVQRQDLTPIEEAISYKKILDMGYLTQENLAEKLGKNQSTVANKLRLLNLDEEVQEALLNEKISERHARSLLKLSNYEDQVKLLNRIISERLTVRKTDEEINKMLNNQDEKTNKVEVLDMDEPIIIPEESEPISSLISGFNIPNNPIVEATVNDETKFNFPSFEMDNSISDSFIGSEIQSLNNHDTVTNESVIPSFNELLRMAEEDEEESSSEQLTPSKFFNILDEVPIVETEIKEDSVSYQEPNNINSDFSNMFNTEKTLSENEMLISPNFGIPSFDDSLFVEEQKQEEIIVEPTNTNTYVAGDIKTVINTIRNCTDTIEKYGFKVDTEEFDLEDMYQVVIKINKK